MTQDEQDLERRKELQAAHDAVLRRIAEGSAKDDDQEKLGILRERIRVIDRRLPSWH